MKLDNKQGNQCTAPPDRYYTLIAKICGAIEAGHTGGYIEHIFKTNTEKTLNHTPNKEE